MNRPERPRDQQPAIGGGAMDQAATDPVTTRFAFRFDPAARKLLAGAGITPANAWVEVGDGLLTAQFGRWRLSTPLANVADARTTGLYQWWKALGVRLSLADRGLTFGSTSQAGVCIRFRRPVAGIEPFGMILHPALTVTVTDIEGLARRLAAR